MFGGPKETGFWTPIRWPIGTGGFKFNREHSPRPRQRKCCVANTFKDWPPKFTFARHLALS